MTKTNHLSISHHCQDTFRISRIVIVLRTFSNYLQWKVYISSLDCFLVSSWVSRHWQDFQVSKHLISTDNWAFMELTSFNKILGMRPWSSHSQELMKPQNLLWQRIYLAKRSMWDTLSFKRRKLSKFTMNFSLTH